MCAGNFTSARRNVRSGGIIVLDFVGVVKVFWAGRGVSQVFGEGLSEAGFTGLLGIFRIAGSRLMSVERILFAWSERGDCGGIIFWDARLSLGLSRISCGRCLKQDLQDYWGFSGLQAIGCCLLSGSFLRGVKGQIAEGRLFGMPRSLGLSRISCGRCLKQDLQDYWGFSGLQASGCCLFGGSFLSRVRGQIAEGR